jgi:S1-C subfamily serine protease
MVCRPSIRIGAFALNEQAVRAQMRSDDGAFSSEEFGGILGSDALRQFEITFDLKNNTVYLTPDSSYKVDPYRYTTGGIKIAKGEQGIFQIMSVWRGSPVAKAGIQAGDQMKALDGQTVEAQTLEQVSSKLYGREGTEVEFAIQMPVSQGPKSGFCALATGS